MVCLIIGIMLQKIKYKITFCRQILFLFKISKLNQLTAWKHSNQRHLNKTTQYYCSHLGKIKGVVIKVKVNW